jgi:hypothetical protein
MRVSGFKVSSLVFGCWSFVVGRKSVAALPFQEELGQFHIRRRSDLYISRGAHHHYDFMPRTLDQ